MKFSLKDTDTRDQVNELLSYERKIRDPIYDYIDLTELECIVIDTPTFQRLDRIGQMHTVHKVYPGADYSRKVHSLGAMHLTGKAITRLLYLQDQGMRRRVPPPLFADKPSTVSHTPYLDDLCILRGIFKRYDQFDSQFLNEFEKDWISEDGERKHKCIDVSGGMEHAEGGVYAALVFEAVRLLGLLHDVGHGPFSHKLEQIEGVTLDLDGESIPFDHEDMAPRMIDEVEEEVMEEMESCGYSDIKKECFSVLIDFARTIIRTDEENMPEELHFLKHLIDFPFDCDMLDYIVRDSYFAGTPEYGQADVDRIIRGFVVGNGGLKISKSQLPAVSNAFESLFDMYRAVYFHRTTRTFDIILEKALSPISGEISTAIINSEDFKRYDDAAFIHWIKYNPNESFDRSRKYIDYFLKRNKAFVLIMDSLFVVRAGELHRAAEEDDDFDIEENKLFEYAKSDIQGLFTEIESKEDEDILSGTSGTIMTDAIYNIRRAGLGIYDLLHYVSGMNLYDPQAHVEDSAFLSFNEVDPDISERLTRIEVPIRVYLEWEREDDHNSEDDTIDENAKEELKEKLKNEIDGLIDTFKDDKDYIISPEDAPTVTF